MANRRVHATPLWRRPAVLAVAALLVIAALTAAWALKGPGAKTRAASAGGGADPRNIAVLYFEDQSPGHELAWLADGLTEGLIASLREVQDLHVVSKGGAEQYRASALPLDSIAHALGVGTLVRGSVEPEGGDVRVTVRLLDGAIEFQRATFRKSAANPLAIRDSLSVEVARLVRARLGEEIRLRGQREGTTSSDAWVLLQRGDRLLRQMDSLSAAGDTIGVSRSWAEADSLLGRAESLDPRWGQPIVLRATFAYRRSRYAEDPTAAGRWIETGIGHADRALALDGRDPDALEARGTLRYWKWLNELERDPAKAQALLMSAKTDLELATTVRPSQAGAWASLSHLYYQIPTTTGLDVNNAARRAMEEDAYLANADVILSRLFISSYDLAQFPDARHWCDEGLRRFPEKWRFTECRLLMLTTRAESPDVAAAWRLADSMVIRQPATQKPFGRLSANLSVAAVLARAGQADSARRVAGRSLGNAEVDASRDLALRAAFVYGLLADTTAAINQLKAYFNANPSKRAAYAADAGWWLRPVETTAAFRQLVGAPAH